MFLSVLVLLAGVGDSGPGSVMNLCRRRYVYTGLRVLFNLPVQSFFVGPSKRSVAGVGLGLSHKP